MDSRLDNVFHNVFRQTESTDTWMGIRREEPRDDPRRKKGDEEEKKEEPKWEDNAVVSIAALKQFLTTLIAPGSEFQKAAPTLTETHNLSPQQRRAHNAASAYQTTARHVPSPAPVTAPEAKSDSPTLTQEENRIIHQLMNDLEVLLQNGVTSLVIQKEGSFLESLSQSAKAALERLP